MKNYLLWLAGLLLAASPVFAQAQAGPLHLAQTIELGPKATLRSTLLLSNHNTVLLLTDSDSPMLLAQCLAPDGHTLWKTALTFYETSSYTSAIFYSIITKGNEVILEETINEDVAKQQRKAGNLQLHEGQILVQRLDEQGHLTQHLFEPPPTQATGKIAPGYLVMGHYVDDTGYAEIVQEISQLREKYQTGEHGPEQRFAIYHYNLTTSSLSRELLVLPTVPKSSRYKFWYTDWAYLGHYQDRLYFCRRSLEGDTAKQVGQGPLLFHTYITDEHGKTASPGGFTTPVRLPLAGTRVAYSGHAFNNSELSHIPRIMVQVSTQGYGTATTSSGTDTDSWDTTTGGMGSFYLDYATGDVLLYGEYTNEDLKQFNRDHMQGVFFQRVSPDGKLLAQLQTPYSAEMTADKNTVNFFSDRHRYTYFHADPLTGQYHYIISPNEHLGSTGIFDLVVDHDLHWQRYNYLSYKDEKKRTLTSVIYALPYNLYRRFYSASSDVHTYEHSDTTDPPVYAALERLRQPDGLKPIGHVFYLSAIGAGTGLVVERMQYEGGTLKVYTF